MLITNFSAGELSEDLFGRIDLGQYYQGAARLENFDIIPTGGIEKRRGTKNILSGLSAGRLVPFVISRDEVYLLHFTYGQISCYRAGQWEKPAAVFIGDDISTAVRQETLYTHAEIPFVHHAQNSNKMVLVQENHPPLVLSRDNENGLSIKILEIRIEISVVVINGELDAPFEMDEDYKKYQFLRTPGNYPRAVTFMNGRLVFAGTKNNPQRLFFSRVNNINDFSTYKKYLTESREYTIVEGTLHHGSPDIIINPGEDSRFVPQTDLKNYFIDGHYFPPKTSILKVESDTITMSEDATVQGITHNEQTALDIWKGNADNINNDKTVFQNVSAGTSIGEPVRSYMRSLHIGAGEVKVVTETASASYKTVDERIFILDQNTALAARNETDVVNGSIYSFFHILVLDTSYTSVGKINESLFLQAVKQIIEYAMDYMFYTFRGREIIGHPNDIYAQVIRGSYLNTHISFCLQTILEENYPTADDGFTFEIASDRNDEIRWLVQNKGLIAGTESAEYVIPPTVTAVNISAHLNSFYGSSRLQATSAGDAVLFFREGNRGLVEYYIPQADNFFRTNDLMLFAKQMLLESEVVDFDISTSPYTRVILTRADGSLVIILYDRSLGVFAWGRHTGAGKVKSLAVVPGKSGFDDIYLLVERGGGNTLELLETDGTVYLDNYKKVTRDTNDKTRAEYMKSGAMPELCRVYRGESGEYLYENLFAAAKETDWNKEGEFFIGFPYKSVIRTLPVLANDRMAKNRITSLTFRFLKSYLPVISSIARGRTVKTDTITNQEEPFSGVYKVPFPGTWESDVQAELTHWKAEPVKILALNAEVQ